MPTAYRFMLSPLNRAGWVAAADDVTFGAASLAIDGNTSTFWANNGAFPTWLTLDMLTPQTFDSIAVLPRQDSFQDRPGSIEVYVSTDGVTWGAAVYTQSGLPNDNSEKLFGPFPGGAVTRRYVKYQILSAASGARNFQGAAEANVGTRIPVYVTVANNAPPLVNTDVGAKHQIVKAPTSIASTPHMLDPDPVAVEIKGGTVGVVYSETITTVGGTAPYTYSLASGTLPPGTTLSTGGVIAGTPTTAGTYSFTVTTTDAAGLHGSQLFSVIIAAAASGGNYGYAG